MSVASLEAWRRELMIRGCSQRQSRYYREMVLRSTTLGESAWMLTGTFPLQSIAHF